VIAAAAAFSTPAHAQTTPTSAPFTAVSGALTQYTNYTMASTQSTLYSNYQYGSSLASAGLSWSGNCTTCSGYAVAGSGNAVITNGTFGDSATLSATGTTPGGDFVLTAASESEYGDLLTITGGTGGGVLALQYTLSGSISASGTGTNVSLVLGGLASAPTGTVTYANGTALTTTLGSFLGTGTHSDTVAEYIPFTYGTAFAIVPELLTDPAYFSSLGNTAPYTTTVDFYNTMSLNSALVYGGSPLSLGELNASADISAASGIGYGPNGLTPAPVPLPATEWLLLSGLGGLLVLARRRPAQTEAR
jgi:hypothetical protein